MFHLLKLQQTRNLKLSISTRKSIFKNNFSSFIQPNKKLILEKLSGNSLSSNKLITILGGGISGLSAAYFLKDSLPKDYQILLIEKKDTFGGWIQTQTINNFLFELGPRSIRTAGNGEITQKLISDLQIKDQMIFANLKYATRRFLFVNKSLQQIPNSLLGILTSPLMRPAILPVVLESFKKRNNNSGDDESIHSFFERRFGSYVADTFVSSLVLGIFAGDSTKLSIKSCFPSLYQTERQYGSVLYGLIKSSLTQTKNKLSIQSNKEKKRNNGIFSFSLGLKFLVDTLVASLQKQSNITLLPSTTIEQLQFNSSKQRFHFQFQYENQPFFLESDYVLSSIPSKVLSNFLSVSNPSPSNSLASMISLLNQIKYCDIIIINIGFSRDLIPERFKGFGYLVPPKADQHVLGITFDSITFPEQNSSTQTRLTVMMGGDTKYSSHLFSLPEKQLEEIALQALTLHLGISLPKPDVIQVTKCSQAIPQYFVGHSQKITEIQQHCNNEFNGKLVLLGNVYNGISLNDCIASSKNLTHNLLISIK